MNLQHKESSQGRWQTMSLTEQMANIGSEVGRALNWKAKNNAEYCVKACERALELVDLTFECPANRFRLKEIARVREALVDYFWGTNQFASSEKSWRRYFDGFAMAARKAT